MLRVNLEPVRNTLRAIATTVIPETASLAERAWLDVEAVIARALSRRPERMQRQLIFFLKLVQALPIARHGRPFTSLSQRNRIAVLERLERSPLLLMRRGFWGVRALVFMGYYTRDEIALSLGYRATTEGWSARGGTVSTVPLAPTLWVEP